MKTLKSMPGLNLAAGGVVLLVVLGVLVDVAVLSPRMDELTRLTGERSDLELRLGTVVGSKFRQSDAERALRIEDLDAYLDSDVEDVTSYIGRMITQAGLTRLELSTNKRSETDQLVRTDFSMRVNGRYDQIVEFVKIIESNERFAAIDEFSIQAPLIGDNLEGRFNLSIYDPITRQGS